MSNKMRKKGNMAEYAAELLRRQLRGKLSLLNLHVSVKFQRDELVYRLFTHLIFFLFRLILLSCG